MCIVLPGFGVLTVRANVVSTFMPTTCRRIIAEVKPPQDGLESSKDMLQQIANIITESIEEITRRWVEELRHSDRTEIHKQLLTSEIVSGMKALLGNLADAV